MDKVERVNAIQRLASKGMSAMAIALHFEGASRSAILGVASRNNITLKGGSPARSGKGADRKPAQRKRADKPPPVKTAKVVKIRKVAKKAKPDQAETTCDVLEFKPRQHGPIGILDLTESTCRWPAFDNPRGKNPEDLLFCGGHSDGRYCTEHSRLAYEKLARVKEESESKPRQRRKLLRWQR